MLHKKRKEKKMTSITFCNFNGGVVRSARTTSVFKRSIYVENQKVKRSLSEQIGYAKMVENCYASHLSLEKLTNHI